jgi:2',3'-cyclic-nucleotide 2'-phosphodiesterase (5'-nucleotidase family)
MLMRFIPITFLVVLISFLSACNTGKLPTALQAEHDLVEFTVLHLNDVYEIAPLEGGKKGGLARVATLKQQLMKENPNTIAVLSGDFLSPSLAGTLKKDDGEKIAGEQMVETLNVMGLDYVTFGNHEFDLKTGDLLQKRINASTFEYTVCNVNRVDGGVKAPFVQTIDGVSKPIPRYIIREFKNSSGTAVRVGIIGVVLPFNQKDYVHYDPVVESFKKTYEAIKDKTDVVIALTHLSIKDDLSLAKEVPGVLVFMGGHDHVNMNHYVEETVITKADANAKSAYIHRVVFSKSSGMSRVRSTLMPITDALPSDPATKEVVDKWQGLVHEVVIKQGYDPDEKLMMAEKPLECKEEDIRSRQTNYGALTVDALETFIPGANVYLLNSGSMRMDDDIQGTVTQYDVLRTFPFGGGVVETALPGNVLQQLLEIGLVTNKGEGGYCQVKYVTHEDGQWMVNEQAINVRQKYKVVMPEFMAKGLEANLGFLKDYSYDKKEMLDNGKVKNDIRDIVIAYMRTLK